MKLMGTLGGSALGGTGTEAAADDELMPMMQGMMKSLLSKDILYPSLKDISAKVRLVNCMKPCYFCSYTYLQLNAVIRLFTAVRLYSKG
jgi:Pex19 protein family